MRLHIFKAPDCPFAMSPSAIVGLRRKLGLSQKQLAARLKMARITVSAWERGILKPGPKAEKKLRRLAA